MPPPVEHAARLAAATKIVVAPAPARKLLLIERRLILIISHSFDAMAISLKAMSGKVETGSPSDIARKENSQIKVRYRGP